MTTQKANIWKRISALLLDIVILMVISVGIVLLLSLVTGYDAKADELNAFYDENQARLDVTQEQFDAMSDEEKASVNETASQYNNMALTLLNLTFMFVSVGVLCGYLVTDIMFPLIFKNGQTLGKKIFGVAVMHVEGVRLSFFQLFVRTILGKYTIETMLPIFLILLWMFMPVVTLAGFGVLLVAQVAFIIVTRGITPIHDMLAATVTVDMASQRIFNSVDEKIAYQKKLHEEATQEAEYR